MSNKITDRIKTMEDVWKELNLDPKTVLPFADSNDPDLKAVNATTCLIYLYKALNEGWTPDWNNSMQYKYWPWFEMTGSGLAFFGADYHCSASDVSSRLCLRSRELVEHAVKHFMNLYEDLFLIKTK